MPSYRAMFRSLMDAIAPRPGEAILEIGCGAGSLVRLLAQRFGAANPITAADVNPFLLREAAQLAEADGLAGLIQFRHGNAEALPFEDNSYDCVYSVTVFEECDAVRAIAEATRVARPGGRVGLVVRALDMRQWWNLTLPEAILRKVEAPPRSVAPAGVADRSLYRRMRDAGFVDLVCFPSMVTLDRPGGPIWRNREDHILSLLSPDELAVWQAERDRAEAGTLALRLWRRTTSKRELAHRLFEPAALPHGFYNLPIAARGLRLLTRVTTDRGATAIRRSFASSNYRRNARAPDR